MADEEYGDSLPTTDDLLLEESGQMIVPDEPEG
jgi:hypothetical protein